MKPRIKARLYFKTKENRAKTATDIETDLSSKNIHKKDLRLSDWTPEDGVVFVMTLDVAMNDKNEKDDSYGKLKTLLKDESVLRGELSSHDCTHDDPVVKPCDQSNYVVDRK